MRLPVRGLSSDFRLCLKVLLPFPLLVDGIQDGLPLGVVPHPQLVDFPLHFLQNHVTLFASGK
jgi:hypothetical protein